MASDPVDYKEVLADLRLRKVRLKLAYENQSAELDVAIRTIEAAALDAEEPTDGE